MSEDLIPIAMFVGLTVVLCVLIWFRFKGRSEMHITYRMALDKGQELSPEAIDRLGHPKSPKDKDFRLAVIWLAISVGLALIGVAVPDPDAFRGTLAAAAFPFSIGIAYMILHRFTDRGD